MPLIAPDKDYATDVDAILACVTAKTRVGFVANPNNPTGTLLDKKAIRARYWQGHERAVH